MLNPRISLFLAKFTNRAGVTYYMNSRYLTFFLCFFYGITLAQETPISENTPDRVTDSLSATVIQIVDTINVQSLGSELPTTTIATSKRDSIVFDLQDHSLARQIDSVWLATLYNNDLFEEIYGSITQLDYEPVEYEELSTELLKTRLKELNARTPFNVEYNPSLESVIKGYLKNRRRTMAKLMALSDYYFPMFEEELDRQGLPLEMKYLAIVESALDPKGYV